MFALILLLSLLYNYLLVAMIWMFFLLPIPYSWRLGQWRKETRVKFDLGIIWGAVERKYLQLVNQLTKPQFKTIKYVQIISISSSCLIAFFITYYCYQTSEILALAPAEFTKTDILVQTLMFTFLRLCADHRSSRIFVLLIAILNQQQRRQEQPLSRQQILKLGLLNYLPLQLLSTVVMSLRIHLIWPAPIAQAFVLPILIHMPHYLLSKFLHDLIINWLYYLFFPKAAWRNP